MEYILLLVILIVIWIIVVDEEHKFEQWKKDYLQNYKSWKSQGNKDCVVYPDDYKPFSKLCDDLNKLRGE